MFVVVPIRAAGMKLRATSIFVPPAGHCPLHARIARPSHVFRPLHVFVGISLVHVMVDTHRLYLVPSKSRPDVPDHCARP